MTYGFTLHHTCKPNARWPALAALVAVLLLPPAMYWRVAWPGMRPETFTCNKA